MKTIALAIVLALIACTRTVVVPAPTTPSPPLNAAAVNVTHAFADAKCETVYQLPQLQSARCLVAGGAVDLYCTASDTGYGCSVLREPKEKTPPAEATPGAGSGSSTPPAVAPAAKAAPARKP